MGGFCVCARRGEPSKRRKQPPRGERRNLEGEAGSYRAGRDPSVMKEEDEWGRGGSERSLWSAACAESTPFPPSSTLSLPP